LVAIRWRWREEQLQKFTTVSMITAILISTALSLSLLFLKGYNYNPLWCWIGPNYVECRGEGLSDKECLAKAVLRRNVFYFVPLLICIGITTLIQACIYFTVRTAERKADRWRLSSKMKSSTFKRMRKHKKQVKRTKIVAVQSLLYLACFYISWVPYFVTVLVLQNQNSLLSTNSFWMLKAF
jgi:4-amino-4-deoxy-L-arabinose transferase-like glycosyltransferase